MDKILSTIYLKVKSETKTLAKSAIAQILVKILFSSEKRMSFNDVVSAYKSFTHRNNVDEQMIDEILLNLCENSEIRKSTKKEYYITASRRKQIAERCEASKKRNEYIQNRFFSTVNSDQETIKNWLQDVTLHFFKFFSDEWISDLMKTKDAVIHSKDSIREMVQKRTKSIKGIDKNDLDILPKMFFDFICSKDADVAAYLWEYGTSAFSAQLISNTTGVDKLTLDVFKGSKCLLDTNILMFIKLDASKFHKALVSLENSFKNLGVELGVLYITKQEFQNKIDCQKCLTLQNLENLGYELTSQADDDFTKSAISLYCRRKEDFVTYFENLRGLPKFLKDNLEIQEIDYSPQLANEIEKTQNSDEKNNELNAIFKTATGRDKRHAALRHDVGLIAGVQYLRNEEKWFILSEEVSINNYSKQKPTLNGLPLALRVETLINVLALQNGGESFDADDYMSLFASIIQNDFQPPKETFVQEDLYAIYELNQQIALLPKEQKKDIVYTINAKRLKGESEDALRVELERAITKGKIQVADDLNDTRKELTSTRKEAQRQKDRGDEAVRALRLNIEKQVTSKYNRQMWIRGILFLMGIPLSLVIIYILYSLIKNNLDDAGQSAGFLIGIVTNIAVDLIIAYFGYNNIINMYRQKKSYIKEKTELILDATLKKEQQ